MDKGIVNVLLFLILVAAPPILLNGYMLGEGKPVLSIVICTISVALFAFLALEKKEKGVQWKWVGAGAFFGFLLGLASAFMF